MMLLIKAWQIVYDYNTYWTVEKKTEQEWDTSVKICQLSTDTA